MSRKSKITGLNKGVRFFCEKISGNSCIIYTLVAKALKDNLILFFDIRMYVAFRSVEKIRIVLLKTIVTILMIMMAVIIIFKERNV